MLDRITMTRVRSIDSYGGMIWDMALHKVNKDEQDADQQTSNNEKSNNIQNTTQNDSGSDSNSDSDNSDSNTNSDSDSDSDSDAAMQGSDNEDDEEEDIDTSYIAVACEDGTIRTFDVSDTYLTYNRSTPRGDGRQLSICLHEDGDTMYAGSSDGLIRCYSRASSAVLFRVTVENYGKDSTKVWALNVLQDYTVISGDSLGHVQLWDGRHGTLLKSFSQHTADVTCLAISSDEKSIYASGKYSKRRCEQM